MAHLTREEAEQRGFTLNKLKPSALRRASWHDYSAPGVYMLTLVADRRQPIFGTLEGEPSPHVVLSRLGHSILFEEIPVISSVYTNVSVLKTIIMPDHIHMLVCVLEPFPPKRTLGSLVGGFKTGCNKARRRLGYSTDFPLFETGYHDRIIMGDRQIEAWDRYIDDNPRRLWLKRQRPHLFAVRDGKIVVNHKCQMLGNETLLDNPDMEAVIYHRGFSDGEWSAELRRWRDCCERGGVLVSAAIAPQERDVVIEAMGRGHKVITIHHAPFPPLYKPGEGFFEGCNEGLLLQIAFTDLGSGGSFGHISRSECLKLNALAVEICGGGGKCVNLQVDYV